MASGVIPKRRAPRRAHVRGFTTVDLMVTVLIVGVLATLGVTSLRRHVQGAKTVELTAVMQAIRGAEESWRAENMTYLNVSTSGEWYPANPAVDGNGTHKRSFYYQVGAAGHADNDRWHTLNVRVDGPVQYGYLVNAGLPGDPMTPPRLAGVTVPWVQNLEPWYVIQAIADVDADEHPAFHMASSLNHEIFAVDPGE